MIVDGAHYVRGVRQHDGPLGIDEAAERAERGDGFVWLGLHDPTDAELRDLEQHFPLDELALEDARVRHQRAKIEDYPGHIFFVVRTADYHDREGELDFGEIHAFIGENFAITLRYGRASELRSARKRLEANAILLRAGPVSVMWAVLDKVVDDYEPVAARLGADIEDVEFHVFSAPDDPTERIYFLRREVIEFHRAVHPLLLPLGVIERGGDPRVQGEIIEYFRDVYDHMQRVHEEIAADRDLLTGALEANLAVLSVSQNETTKQLTIIATIFLPLTFITGFFGMNFAWLTNHTHPLWVFLVFGVGSLVISCIALFIYFRRSGYA
ncbi:MAG TPA: magnesium and cobalt transport protein CorA [Solirubrobacteraceae bacterium]|jgi:magnesium transporter